MDLESLPIAREARIVCHPQIRGGAPVIAGTRIPVWSVVLYSNYGEDREAVVRGFDLTWEEIDAALAYYADHRAEVDRYITENVAVD